MEHVIKNKLNSLPADQLKNVKAHARLADQHGEKHESHKIVTDWITNVAKAGGYVMVAGGAAKLIKVIINH